jgi:hypothetical protein
MKVLAVAIIVAGLSLSGLAQEKSAFKAKHSAPEKPAKAAPVPVGKSATVGTSSAGNAKDLQTLERQTAKSSGAPHATGTKMPRTAAVKPIKDKSNPPIKVGSAGNGGGLNHQSANPYKGRLKQKYNRQ